MNRTALSLLALMISLEALASSAHAAPTDAKARKAMEEASTHFRRGVKLFEEGDAAAALVEFKRANEIAPNWSVLYNIAGCYYQLGDYAHALTTYEQYLKDGAADVPAKKRGEVQKELEELRTRVGKVTVKTAKGAEVLIDDESLGTAPLAAPALVSAGRRKVTVRPVDAPPINRMVDVVGGDVLTVEVAVSLAKPATASLGGGSEAREESTGGRTLWPWWVATGVLAADGAVFGVLAMGASKDLQNLRGAPNPDANALTSAQSRTRTFSIIADVSGAVAIGVGAFSLWYTLSSPSAGKKAGEASLRVAVGPGTFALAGCF
jgi:hypothetical protein